MFLSNWRKKREFKKNIIYGKQVIEKWGVDAHELSYIILKENLSILDLPNKLTSHSIFDPHHYKIEQNELIEIVRFKPESLRDRAFWLPEIQKATEYVKLLPKEAISDSYSSTVKYSRGDLPSREDKREILQKEPTDVLKNIIEERESAIKKNPNVFSLIGKVWFVKYKEKEWGLFPDLEKYKYIACLLELTKSYSQSREYSIYNSELIAKIKGSSALSDNDDENLKEDLSESDLRENLTPDEFNRFKDIGYDLLEKLNESKQADDPIEIKEAEKNFKKYQSYILNEYGIKSQTSKDGKKIYFGTYYRSSKESEKLRQSIKNQTNNAIKDFKNSMPMLGQHLQICLSTKLHKTLYTTEGIKWLV